MTRDMIVPTHPTATTMLWAMAALLLSLQGPAGVAPAAPAARGPAP